MHRHERRWANKHHPGNSKTIPVEDFVVPEGIVAITLDVSGANPVTCQIKANQFTDLMTKVDKISQGRDYHDTARMNAAAFLEAKRNNDDDVLTSVGVVAAWTALNHPQSGEAMRQKLSDALRREGKAHISWHVSPKGLFIGLGERFLDLEPIAKKAPKDAVITFDPDDDSIPQPDMGEARRRKLARVPTEDKFKDGVINLTFNIDPIPQLNCVLPTRNAMKQLDNVAPDLRSVSYENLVRVLRSEFAKANQTQDPRDIEFATIIALYTVLYNPQFGSEVRALAAEIRSNRHNLGLNVVYQQNKLALGVATGMANLAIPQTQETFPPPKAMASDEWRTRADHEHIAPYGLSDLHMVMFESLKDRGGMCHTVTISIPETPPRTIGYALSLAREAHARTTFMCDTAEQAEAVAASVAPNVASSHRL